MEYTARQLNEMTNTARFSAYEKIANESSLTEIMELPLRHRVPVIDMVRGNYDARYFLELTPKGKKQAKKDKTVNIEGIGQTSISFKVSSPKGFSARSAVFLLDRYGKEGRLEDCRGLLQEVQKLTDEEEFKQHSGEGK